MTTVTDTKADGYQLLFKSETDMPEDDPLREIGRLADGQTLRPVSVSRE